MQPLYLVRQLQSKEVKIHWVDTICTKNSSLTVTFDHVTWTSIQNIYSLGTSTIPSLATFKEVKRYWADNICTKTSNLTLDQTAWKSIGNIYSLVASNVLSLATFKQCGQKILSGQHLYKDQQFELGTDDMKINREHLLSKNINCIKFGNF